MMSAAGQPWIMEEAAPAEQLNQLGFVLDKREGPVGPPETQAPADAGEKG